MSRVQVQRSAKAGGALDGELPPLCAAFGRSAATLPVEASLSGQDPAGVLARRARGIEDSSSSVRV